MLGLAWTFTTNFTVIIRLNVKNWYLTYEGYVSTDYIDINDSFYCLSFDLMTILSKPIYKKRQMMLKI